MRLPVPVLRSVRWSWRGVVAVACLGGVWFLVATLSYYSIPLANNWLVGLMGWLGGWGLAIAVSLGVTVVAWRSRRRLMTVLTLTLGLLAATTIWSVDWPSVYVHRFFRVNRAGFVDALARYEGVTSPGLDGVLMVESLRHLSVDGRATSILSRTVPGGPPALFLPQVLGLLDGGAGYAHLQAGQERETFDCLGDPCRADVSLGDNWYWVE